MPTALPSPRIRRAGAALVAIACLLGRPGARHAEGAGAGPLRAVRRDHRDAREEYGFPRGSALVGPVNRALSALMADGTLARLRKKWLTVRLDALPVLR